MKTNFFLVILIFIISTVSCSKDDEGDGSEDGNGEELWEVRYNVANKEYFKIASEETWRITLFEENGVNQATKFTDYNFTFSAVFINNSTNLIAGIGTKTYYGQWVLNFQSFNYPFREEGSTLKDLHFDIGFNFGEAQSSIVNDLSENWEIIEITDIKIKLKHIREVDGGTNYLTFEKN
jgi:hypothetical protein